MMDIFESIFDIVTDCHPDVLVTSEFPHVDDLYPLAPFVVLDESPTVGEFEAWNSAEPLGEMFVLDVDIFAPTRREAIAIGKRLRSTIHGLVNMPLGVSLVDDNGIFVRNELQRDVRRVGMECFVSYRPS